MNGINKFNIIPVDKLIIQILIGEDILEEFGTFDI